MSELNSIYTQYYRERNPEQVYPTEFVVRAFLAKYPRLHLDKTKYTGAKILDLGFGDGRNTEFLCQQGFRVFGTEITNEIGKLAAERLQKRGYEADLRVGTNTNLPFDDAFFDYILAVHACYYLDEGDTFHDNLREISRVLKAGGYFIGSIPMVTNHYFTDSEDLGNGVRRIRKDHYGIRDGFLVMGMESTEQIEEYFQEHFEDIRFGRWENDFWGIEERMYLFVCRRRDT